MSCALRVHYVRLKQGGIITVFIRTYILFCTFFIIIKFREKHSEPAVVTCIYPTRTLAGIMLFCIIEV